MTDSAASTTPSAISNSPNSDIGNALFTAEQIKKDCPPELLKLGERFTEAIKKADHHRQNMDEWYYSAGLLLAEAKQACSDGGFRTFCQRFGISKTAAYQCLSVVSGRKTAEQVRAENAERNRRYRKNKKETAETVHHVMDAEAGAKAPSTSQSIGPITYDLEKLSDTLGEAKMQAAAGNATRVKEALRALRRETDRALEADCFSATPRPEELSALDRRGPAA